MSARVGACRRLITLIGLKLFQERLLGIVQGGRCDETVPKAWRP